MFPDKHDQGYRTVLGHIFLGAGKLSHLAFIN